MRDHLPPSARPEDLTPPGPPLPAESNAGVPTPGEDGASPAERSDRRVERAQAQAAALPGEGRLLDLLAVAIAGGTSVRTVQSWVAEGRLRVTRIGRCTRVRVSDWIQFLDRSQAS
jgi:hypothetical protein